MTVTRFAPSPSGWLHLGHAYSALFSERLARDVGGRFLLRIEDIDTTRCRAEFEDGIYEDLAWLGITPDESPVRQSDRFHLYDAALSRLDEMGLLYRCYLSRKELNAALSAPHIETGQGPDGPVIRDSDNILDPEEQARRQEAGDPFALRLRMDEAIRRTGPLTWQDRRQGEQTAQPQMFGDVVLARKDIRTSYHLAVTVDDAEQGVTLVTRGEDLFAATHIHRLLQALLDLPVPEWAHHELITDDEGKRLAKRDNARSIKELREQGAAAADIRAELDARL